MFVKQLEINTKELLEWGYKNLGVNYFILMGLSISKEVYSEIYYIYNKSADLENLEAVLFKRQSGNLQLMTFRAACSVEVMDDFKTLIKSLPFKTLITSQHYVKSLKAESLFTSKVDGAYVYSSKEVLLSHQACKENEDLRLLSVDDVETIEHLYKMVFKSFTPAPIMRQKLASGRGRALGLFYDKQLIAVAQTDFESSTGAIIVGVATHPNFQKKGYGHKIMSALCEPLMIENKTMFLHYDSVIAGKLYKKMGFKAIDQIGHYYK